MCYSTLWIISTLHRPANQVRIIALPVQKSHGFLLFFKIGCIRVKTSFFQQIPDLSELCLFRICLLPCRRKSFFDQFPGKASTKRTPSLLPPAPAVLPAAPEL